ncbi:MAG TPA: hypothetical protein VGR62_14810 [Candidatus Binatia bacterium]|nr:hypothetical protein [Candidatus Binatia bacterium]
MRSALRRMTLGLGLIALASPVLLLTDPIRQRAVAEHLRPTARAKPAPDAMPDVRAVRGRPLP